MSATATATAHSGGIGLGSLLGVAFIVLKLTHVISWPWLWVLAPFWISFLVVIVLLVIAAIIVFLVDR